MRTAFLLLLLLGLCACADQDQPEQAPLKRSYAYPETDSAWLDTAGQLYTERRAVSPEGVDIRAACYQLAEQSMQFVIQLRNYDARIKDAPDHQWIVQAEVFTGETRELELPDSGIPLRLLPLPDHSRVLMQTATVDPDGRVSDQSTQLMLLTGSGEISKVSGGTSVFPAKLLDDDRLSGWRVSGLQLDRGMLHSIRDWKAGEQYLSLEGAAADNPQATLSISADPVSPARSVVSYLLDLPGTELPTDVQWEFPYHMSYSSESWLPPLFELDSGLLATVLFQPDARGSSSRANYNGLFRLATLDPQDGTVHILHEDIPSKLTILEQDDVLYYCCPTNTDSGTRWEIWATDSIGLHKRRLYLSDDSVYLNLADVSGSRLLLFRQFFAREETQPALFSELLEVSTEGLGRGLARLERRLGGQADGSDSSIPPISF